MKRIYFSTNSTFFIIELSFDTLNTKTNDKIITGRPVANANTEGIKIPSENFNARGINIPKNKTALNGQKAKENITPKSKGATINHPKYFSFFIFLKATNQTKNVHNPAIK